MTRIAHNDLDYLAARLHARRSRMVEAERLAALCRVRSLADLSRLVYPGTEFNAATDFQRRLLQDLAREIHDCFKHLKGRPKYFVEWLLARLRLENLKVLLRGFLNHLPTMEWQTQLLDLPGNLALDAARLMIAKSLAEFIKRLPEEILCQRLWDMTSEPGKVPSLFLLESALDADYLEELLRRTRQLPTIERESVTPLVFHKANFFQFMLIVRGKFHFGLPPETFLPLRLPGSGTSDAWFNRLRSAPDIPSAASHGVGVIIDALPASRRADDASKTMDVPAIEALAWRRFLRLANRAFRRSHLGVGAVAGYFGVRRVEIANLITLSEGARLGLDENAMRAHLISSTESEAAYV
jgi:V/A-type H+-transporting ATPase subunit C